MITPTLIDVATITSLRPTGEVFDPIEWDEDTINFDQKHAQFSKFIADHHETQTGEVSDKEHIFFLTMWLLCFFFGCKFLKVANRFLTLANQSHDVRKSALAS